MIHMPSSKDSSLEESADKHLMTRFMNPLFKGHHLFRMMLWPADIIVTLCCKIKKNFFFGSACVAQKIANILAFFMPASDRWEISSLKRAFHFSCWDLLSLDEPKLRRPKTEMIKTWKVESPTQSWKFETKLSSLEHIFI